MSTRTVLLIAATTGYQIRSFGEAAAALGVNLLFATDRCDRLEDPWRDRAFAVHFHEPSSSARALVEGLDRRPDAIVAVGDRPALLAAHINAELKLPGHSPEAVWRSRNKLAAREAFRQAGTCNPA